MLGGPPLGFPVCGDGSRCAAKGCSAPHPPMAGGPRQRSTLWDQGLLCQAGPGPTSPPHPTWWSPTFHDPGLTHVDPAPHLASIWGWHSWGGRSHLAGKSEDPQGASDPQGRVSEPLQHHAMDAGCSASCSLELGAMLQGGGAGRPQPPPRAASQPWPGPRLLPGPQAALALGDSPQGTPLTSVLMPRSPSHSMLQKQQLGP